jgi:hypothetical protein
MKLQRKWLVALPLVIAGAFGTAAAQTSPTPEVKAGAKVSADEQVKAADALVGRLQASSTRVRHLLDEARRQKDVVKTTCLSDKLSQIEVATKSAKERQSSMNAAIARNDVEQRDHEFAVVNVLRQRAEQLDAEASQCIGEELGFPGETSRQFTPNPNIAPVDPGSPPPVEVVVVPPLPASGYK